MSTSIIYNKFRYENLKKFINSLTGTDTLYFGIGRPYFWNVGSGVDTTIPQAYNDVSSEEQDWEDMMHLKRVNASDISFGIGKLIWTAGQKYDAYRHDWDGVSRSSAYNSSIYPSSVNTSYCVVENSYDDIYICLKQKVIAGVVQQSLYSPETGIAIGSSTGILKTADGYYWKKLGVTGSTQNKWFTTDSFQPISTLSAAPDPTDPYYVQWTAQQTSLNFKGGIYCINITNGGSGYNSGSAGTITVSNALTDANFRIYGNGSGIKCTVSYGTGGVITDVEITNPGTGYTFATIVPSGGSNATFDIVYTPFTGLGADPVKDVEASYLLVTTRLYGYEGSIFTVANDYRKISLISNPTIYGSSTIATAPTLDATTTLLLGTVTGGSLAFTGDDVVISSASARGKVIDWVAGGGSTGTLRLIKTRNDGYVNSQNAQTPFNVADTVVPVSATGSGTITTVTLPTVQPFSGNVIYSEYRAPQMRAIGQEEYLRCVVQF